MNSVMKICSDIEVCQPGQTNGKGNPVIIETGASTGKTYHHFVKVANEMIVNGKTNFHVNCLTFLFVLF